MSVAAREINVDDGGELSGEAPGKWVRNQASHGFLAWANDLRDTPGSFALEWMQKMEGGSNRRYIRLQQAGKMEIPDCNSKWKSEIYNKKLSNTSSVLKRCSSSVAVPWGVSRGGLHRLVLKLY
jgi:hypothetical protein